MSIITGNYSSRISSDASEKGYLLYSEIFGLAGMFLQSMGFAELLEGIAEGISSIHNRLSFEIESRNQSDGTVDSVSNNDLHRNLVFGSDTKSSDKLANQMSRRGWTTQSVTETYNSPFTTRSSVNKSNGNPATAYFNYDGTYIVVDNITNEIVQVSNTNDPGWAPDRDIINPYIPEDN